MKRRRLLRHVKEIDDAQCNVSDIGAVGGVSRHGGGQLAAAAYDYPYCLQGRGIGIPGECAYTSYAQCMASASGRALYCNVNPRVAFGEQRRMRVYRDY